MKSNLALLASVSVLALTIGAAKADTIDFIGAEISYTVPVSGLYDITAYGAQADRRLASEGWAPRRAAIFSYPPGRR
jgi:hypothetical protein